MIIDGMNAGVSLAVSEVARQKNKLFLVTGAKTSDLTGPNAAPIHGKTKEGNFNLGHLSDIRNKIAHACDWGRTPNEPVGSVVTRSIANLFFCLISNLFLLTNILSARLF